MEADKKLDKRHAIEDAMSDALIRKCPKCEKPFIKEAGCNKITVSAHNT
jgi:TRIAD3 protein (E3 ubiquitin-protein ligase RNF216)